MSIGLVIEYKDTGQSSFSTPVVAFQHFETYWKPHCSRLSLEWVLLVQSAGLPILSHLDELPAIQNELLLLKNALSEQTTGINEGLRDNFIERIELVLNKLQWIQEHYQELASAYLG